MCLCVCVCVCVRVCVCVCVCAFEQTAGDALSKVLTGARVQSCWKTSQHLAR